MIFITLTDERGWKIAINIDAIGYFHRYGDASTTVFITGGDGGEIVVTESPDDIQARLKEAGAEFV